MRLSALAALRRDREQGVLIFHYFILKQLKIYIYHLITLKKNLPYG
jgi:hypothetical protein